MPEDGGDVGSRLVAAGFVEPFVNEVGSVIGCYWIVAENNGGLMPPQRRHPLAAANLVGV